jgi:hypothetical protein
MMSVSMSGLHLHLAPIDDAPQHGMLRSKISHRPRSLEIAARFPYGMPKSAKDRS